MSKGTAIGIFVTVFILAIFLLVILPFFLVRSPAGTTKSSQTGSGKANAKAETQLLTEGIFRSDDSGRTWQQKAFIEGSSASIAPFKINRLIPDPIDAETLYLATDGQGLWITKSGGDLWAPVVDQAGVLDPNSNVLALAVSPIRPKEWFVAVFQENRGRLLVTEDGGLHFRETYAVSLDRFGIFDVAYNRTGNAIEIATGQGGLLESRDRGITWRVNRWFTDGLTRLLFDPTDNRRQYVATPRGSIFRTEDGGASWNDITGGIRNFSGSTMNQHWEVDVNGVLYLGSNHVLLRSTDHGLSFDETGLIIPPGVLPIRAVAIDPANPAHIFVAFMNQIFETRDNGDSWEITPSPSPNTILQLLFDRKNSKTIYVVLAPPTS